MDPLSSLIVRTSLLWLAVGFFAGAVMMSDRWLPGAWRVWLAPTHGHMLFVGWFLQFAFGIGLWLLPRTRTATRPLGYREHAILAGFVLLNLGLGIRVFAEPLQRSQHDTAPINALLVASALAQLTGVALWIVEFWPRLAARVPKHLRTAPAAAGPTGKEDT